MAASRQFVMSALNVLAAVAVFLAPLVLGVAALRVARRGHWAALVLAAPSLLLGMWLAVALGRNARGPAVAVALVYAPLLLAVGAAAVVRWRRRRGSLVDA